ncbi:MAG: hypothetical protein Q9N34_07925 [Aquificota bacterium]|nr:hypothetical protein [Aquificota bacterium]
MYLSVLIFNEELFKEVIHFCSLQTARHPVEEPFFSAVKEVAEFYVKAGERRDLNLNHLNSALKKLNSLGDVYYGVNVVRFRKDLEDLVREVVRSRHYFPVKIGFHMRSDHGKGILKRLISALVSKIRRIGGRRWTLISSETASCCSTETSWKRLRELPIQP